MEAPPFIMSQIYLQDFVLQKLISSHRDVRFWLLKIV